MVFSATYEALKKPLGSAGAVAVILAALSIFVFLTSENYGPFVSPFLVGRWESTAHLENDAWIREPRPILLTLYDDDVASFDGLKGSWAFADVSRSVVRVEIPDRDKARPAKLYELRVRRGEPLWGTMRDSGKILRFTQVEQGGAVGMIAEVIRKEQEEGKKFRTKLCEQTGLRRTAYNTYNWFTSEDGWISCSHR